MSSALLVQCFLPCLVTNAVDVFGCKSKMATGFTNTCLSCNEALSEKSLKMKCVECEYSYHLGACSGIQESTFKTKGESWHSAWRCQTCRISKQRSSKPKKDSDVDVMVALAAMNKKLDSLLDLKETVNGIEQAIQMLSDKYDGVISRMTQQEMDLKELKKRVERVEQDEAKAEIRQLKDQINELEWRSRRQNLELHGIPTTEKENMMEKVNKVARSLRLPELTPTDIVSMHRLASKPDKIPGIIVRFMSQTTRDLWLSKRLHLKEDGNNVYLLENLTKHEKSLLWSAKECAKEKAYKYVWYRNGRVLVRKADGEPVIVIKSIDDLERLR